MNEYANQMLKTMEVMATEEGIKPSNKMVRREGFLYGKKALIIMNYSDGRIARFESSTPDRENILVCNGTAGSMVEKYVDNNGMKVEISPSLRGGLLFTRIQNLDDLLVLTSAHYDPKGMIGEINSGPFDPEFKRTDIRHLYPSPAAKHMVFTRSYGLFAPVAPYTLTTFLSETEDRPSYVMMGEVSFTGRSGRQVYYNHTLPVRLGTDTASVLAHLRASVTLNPHGKTEA